MLPLNSIRALVRERQPALVEFVQRLVRIPSLPGREKEVAVAISQEMRRLNYDEVWTDAVGNVIGKINGGPGPTVLLNGHMDHVDPGPVEGWPYPPFSGQIAQNELWGRGAVDMKGPLAAMIYAVGLCKPLGLTPPGNILLTAAVMEETGGLGTQYLATQLKAAAAICGEPSRNILRRGHRGRVEIRVVFKGRSAHASVPHLGLNPHYQAALFLTQLPTLKMAHDPVLGSSTVAPTLYTTDQLSPNVIPGEVRLTLDWRNVPDESPEMIVAKLGALPGNAPPDAGQTTIEVVQLEFAAYTGLVKTLPMIFPSFLLAEDDPLLRAARTALAKVLGRDDGVDVWRFATDGGHLMAAGIPTIGFGPGDERLAHTNQERLHLGQLEEATAAYLALMLALGEPLTASTIRGSATAASA